MTGGSHFRGGYSHSSTVGGSLGRALSFRVRTPKSEWNVPSTGSGSLTLAQPVNPDAGDERKIS